jgi:hypothetical protein
MYRDGASCYGDAVRSGEVVVVVNVECGVVVVWPLS